MPNQHREKYQRELKDKNFFITVDPGARSTGGTGVVLWSRYQYDPLHIVFAKGYSNTYEMRVNEIINFVSSIEERYLQFIIASREHLHPFEPLLDAHTFAKCNPIPVFIERPRYFDTYKGELTAKSDSLFKLIFCYGCLYQYFQSNDYTYSVPLQIAHWKGQLSDAQVKRRIEDICEYIPPKEYQKADVYAALGMGFYIKGTF